MPAAPASLTIRTYAVGFGDCFLLSFAYEGAKERHVLIDFGSTATRKGAPKDQILRIAKDIKAVTRGKLHAIVESHRHADHISGFATNTRHTGPGDVIRGLNPELIVQPWTEDPKAQEDATKPTKVAAPEATGLRALATLEGMHEVARAAALAARTHRSALDPDLADRLSFIGRDNVKNLSAVENLMSMPKAKHTYVHCDSESGLGTILPGVKVHVLGPPTLEQHAEIQTQRQRDPDEFWQLRRQLWRFWSRQGMASSRSLSEGRKVFPREIAASTPPSLRWFRRRLAQVYGEGLLELVTILDDAMNNTSVILLFEVGAKRLLFPGDAQIEDWEYALARPGVQNLLAGTTLYKVGHHGSLNATPRQKLWPTFRNRSKSKAARNRLLTLLSTREDKHGSVKSGTEVPRRTLLAELKAESDLLSTLDFDPGELCRKTVVAFTRRR